LTILLLPFTAYLLAELVNASGVLAVVSCGLAMTQFGPRVGRPVGRQQTVAFWSLTSYVLNAALFVLIGIELQATVRGLTSDALTRGLLAIGVVAAVLVVVRLVWLFTTVSLIRLIDRRPLSVNGVRRRALASWEVSLVFVARSPSPQPWRCRQPWRPGLPSPTETSSSSSPRESSQ
jgi:NhaP-type Na+/H+ or K+/H+ antiporter